MRPDMVSDAVDSMAIGTFEFETAFPWDSPASNAEFVVRLRNRFYLFLTAFMAHSWWGIRVRMSDWAYRALSLAFGASTRGNAIEECVHLLGYLDGAVAVTRLVGSDGGATVSRGFIESFVVPLDSVMPLRYGVRLNTSSTAFRVEGRRIRYTNEMGGPSLCFRHSIRFSHVRGEEITVRGSSIEDAVSLWSQMVVGSPDSCILCITGEFNGFANYRFRK
ncbi:hypothetical protein FNV43_RR21578 [Rhamnella rubrinervis]|uniref:Uncharacterized protein n=1 Tax=Rhamnella rubrinervis TaxID=2594499 RepID=A0A8K0DUJ0_9ROSA|nr:hypothetical protein FNV43_RR21578 [Rhamnella rubrinervis]